MIRLAEELRAQLEATAAAAAPAEACGFLLGVYEADEGMRICEVFVAENVSPSPHRFIMDTTAADAAIRRAVECEWSIFGVWHSHAAGPAVPSRTDLEHCYWPLAVIVSAELGEVRAWRWDEELAVQP